MSDDHYYEADDLPPLKPSHTVTANHPELIPSLRQRIAELEAKLAATEPTIPIETMEKLLEKDRRIQELEELLLEVKDKGLIYWDCQTSRGAAAKAQMIAKIDRAALAKKVVG